MEIRFVGTGGAFDLAQGTASAIVTVQDQTILIDCGFSTLPRLARHPIIRDIDAILITHLHGDHVGSLPTLLPYFTYILGIEPPKIIVPHEAYEAEVRAFLSTTYEEKRAEFIPLEKTLGIGYVETTNTHVPGMTSFAYYFTDTDALIYYSGDTGSVVPAQTFLRDRTETDIRVFHETTFKTESSVHVPYTVLQRELANYPLYAYHVAKENKPNDCTLQLVEECPELLL